MTIMYNTIGEVVLDINFCLSRGVIPQIISLPAVDETLAHNSSPIIRGIPMHCLLW